MKLLHVTKGGILSPYIKFEANPFIKFSCKISHSYIDYSTMFLYGPVRLYKRLSLEGEQVTFSLQLLFITHNFQF